MKISREDRKVCPGFCLCFFRENNLRKFFPCRVLKFFKLCDILKPYFHEISYYSDTNSKIQETAKNLLLFLRSAAGEQGCSPV